MWGVGNRLKPYQFQQEIIDNARDTHALFCDMGTGKSCILLHIWKDRRPARTIIVTPIITLENWRAEWHKWTDVEPHIITGKTAGQRVKQIVAAINDPQPHKVIVINYDALRNARIRALLKEWGAEFVAADESQKIKNRNSAACRQVIEIAHASRYRYPMSGTPITGTVEDLWSQYFFMDRGKTFGTVFHAFKNRYMINLNAGWNGPKAFPNWVPNTAMNDEITHKLQETAFQIKKEDCLELPDLVTQTMPVELSAQQRKHYDELRDDLITWLDGQPDEPLVVQNALTRILRLNQIASGYARIGATSVSFKDNPRLDHLIELVRNIGQKTIVYCVFKQNYIDIERALGKIKFVRLTGAETSAQKFRNIDEFCKGDAQVCIANPRSAGLGINLTEAGYSIYYSRTHDMSDYAQSRDRNYRGGSIDLHSKITHYHLVAPNTIDEEILRCVLQKKKFADNILDLKRLLKHV